jgi:hypothetical protein
MPLRYETRNHAFTSKQSLALESTVLWVETAGMPPSAIPLEGIATVTLSFAPTRSEPERYRCRLALRRGGTVEFFNRTYEGIGQFRGTSTDYVRFVRGLVASIAATHSACTFRAGSSSAGYAVNVAATAFLALVLVGAALFLIFHGLALVVLLKAALLAIFAPNVIRWLARNRPRAFVPGAIPAAVLPPVTPEPASLPTPPPLPGQ